MENLPQCQSDSTILFDLMINYINLNNVDKIARDLAKLDEIIVNEYSSQDNVENDLDIHIDHVIDWKYLQKLQLIITLLSHVMADCLNHI